MYIYDFIIRPFAVAEPSGMGDDIYLVYVMITQYRSTIIMAILLNIVNSYGYESIGINL